MNRSYLNPNLLMLNSKPSKLRKKFRAKFQTPRSSSEQSVLRTRHAGTAALWLWAALVIVIVTLILPAGAAAQNFSLQAAAFSPDAVAPGGTASSIITVGSVDDFTGTVTLSCVVTSTSQSLVDPPVCSVSPTTITAPASASATVTTQSDTSTVGYSVTISATASTGTQTAAPLTLTVLAVTPQFSITLLSAVTPTSVPAGSGGQGTIIFNPINGYVGSGAGVTLSCASITPLVTIPPVCSFNPPTVGVTEFTSTITISTFGPVITGAVAHPRIFYALWMPVPMLALLGLGAAAGRTRARKAYGLLALFVICGTLVLTPGCGNSNSTTTTPNGVTPNGTYTFTVAGVDSNGVVSSNTGSTTTTGAIVVSLTVNTPTH